MSALAIWGIIFAIWGSAYVRVCIFGKSRLPEANFARGETLVWCIGPEHARKIWGSQLPDFPEVARVRVDRHGNEFVVIYIQDGEREMEFLASNFCYPHQYASPRAP